MMIVETLPQNILPINTITLPQVISVLPDKIPYKANIWIAGKLARYGKTTEGIVFLAEMIGEPSVEMRLFFEKLIEPLCVSATIYEDWQNEKYHAVRIYDNGELLIDKNTMAYKKLPTPVFGSITLCIKDLKLPLRIPFHKSLYLTGGLVKNGWTANDVDFICFDEKDPKVLRNLADFFTKILKWKTHVGSSVMTEREPVFCYLAYEGGVCQRQ